MKTPLLELMEKDVVVIASGIRYRGVLKEVTDERVCLQARTGWREIPVDQVSEIRPGDAVGRKSWSGDFLDWQDF